MIYETDRDNFASVMHVTWQSCGRNKPDRDTMRYWFDKLIAFDFKVVADAFDKWLMTQDELPTVHQITKLCKPVTPIYSAIERKHDKEANKQHAHKIAKLAHETFKPKRDMKAWAREIIDNPKAYPDISLRYACEALGVAVDG